MKINSPDSKKRWDEFLKEQDGIFTQSIEWGRFKSNFQEVKRLEARENGKLKGVCQALVEDNFFGKYFYIPYGPVTESKEIKKALLKEIKKVAKDSGATFLKVEPDDPVKQGRPSHHRIQPAKTLVLDIDRDPEDILAGFKEGTRYDVRYARRQGVEIVKEKDLESFFNLLRKTQSRKEFESFSKDYFSAMLKDINCDLFLAKSKQGEVVATTIFGYFGNRATSLHSAFDYEKRKLRATALIRFEAIKASREEGCTKFDAWGIDEEKMPGVTKFKKGFGGREVKYPVGKDIFIKKLRSMGYYLSSKLLKE